MSKYTFTLEELAKMTLEELGEVYDSLIPRDLVPEYLDKVDYNPTYRERPKPYIPTEKDLAEIEARIRGAKLADEGFAEVHRESCEAEESLIEGMTPEEYQELIWRGAEKPKA